jgi:formylmethanofuran dehydrogenase subunit E
MNTPSRKFFEDIEPIRLREPLAETLGAFQAEGTVLEYTITDVLKMAGHSCPTVSGAYLVCQEALKKLYPGDIPVRGEIAVTVHGEPDECVFGVMGQVFGYVTGAAPLTGFKGLGVMIFEFKRLYNGQNVLVEFLPDRIPFPDEKARRLGQLLEKVIWEAAKKEEVREFQDLWMEKVRLRLVEKKSRALAENSIKENIS